MTGDRTSWRMEAMCRDLGVAMDPAEAVHSAMAARCARCTKGAACLLWRLAADGSETAAPGYCLNAEGIAALRAQQSSTPSESD